MESKPPPGFRKTTETFSPGAKTLPQDYFVAEEVFAKERERVFASQWLCVGHQSQIGKTGDHFVPDVMGESLIIVRDQQQTIRGFYNVCRHRGTRLCEDKHGHFQNIQCPYHAWTYGLDGQLIGAPHMEKVDGFDKADYSLNAVSPAFWEGFIFVNLAKAHAAGDCLCAAFGQIHALEPAEAPFRPPNRVRRARELEVDLRELLRVLSLSARASRAFKTVALRLRRE